MKFSKSIKKSILVVMSLSFVGCASLSRSEREMARELKSYGVRESQETVKHPGLAGGLNLLPGFGNFYLAAGTDETVQWPVGFLNLLFWPVSIIWGVPQAAVDANTINKKETIYYYKYDRQGKKEYEALRSEHMKEFKSKNLIK